MRKAGKCNSFRIVYIDSSRVLEAEEAKEAEEAEEAEGERAMPVIEWNVIK